LKAFYPIFAATIDSMNKDIELSIIVPLYNEEKVVLELHQRLSATLKKIGKSYEIVFIDDGSVDNSYSEALSCKDDKTLCVQLYGNYGQTLALKAGVDHASGEIIVMMDGDLQHMPEEIPLFLEKMEEGYDVVSGWRKKRVDGFILRRLPSMCANYLMKKISGIDLHDFGTTFKAYKKDVIKSVHLYGEFHRFIPVLVSKYKVKIAEIPIQNIDRPVGSSNYGITRTFTVFFDLIRLKFFQSYMSKPLQIFGVLGIIFFCGGASILSYLIFAKYYYDLGLMVYRPPLFICSIFSMLMGIQFFTFGLLAELISKFYVESNTSAPYLIRKIK
jgi:glycosyltransferase involved in cell wall biosynthesis